MEKPQNLLLNNFKTTTRLFRRQLVKTDFHWNTLQSNCSRTTRQSFRLSSRMAVLWNSQMRMCTPDSKLFKRPSNRISKLTSLQIKNFYRILYFYHNCLILMAYYWSLLMKNSKMIKILLSRLFKIISMLLNLLQNYSKMTKTCYLRSRN